MPHRRGLVFVAVIAASLVLPAVAGSGAARSACPATPRASRPPLPYANLSGSWWVKNYLWVGVSGAFHGEGFEALPKGQKVGWYRGRPGLIRLYAKRLDGPPADFTSYIPAGTAGSGSRHRISCSALPAAGR